MTAEDDRRAEADELIKRAIQQAGRGWNVPPIVWQRTLFEVGPCRMCSRAKLLCPATGAEVCYHCDIDPAHPPKLRDLR